jgi:hypothetical protein
MSNRNKLVFIIILTIIFKISTGSQQKLGILHKTREVILGQGEDIRQVTIIIPVGHSQTDYKVQLSHIESHIKKIQAIPGLANNTEQYKTVGHVLKQLTRNQMLLTESIQHFTNYQDENNDKEPTGLCKLSWNEYKPSLIEETVKDLNTVTATLKLDSDSATFVSKPEKFYETYEILERVQQKLEQLTDLIFDRLRLLEMVSNKQVTGELLAGIQSQSCILAGKIERVSILQCEKAKKGLICELQVQVPINQVNYELYIPINFRQIQLTIEPGKYLVKKNQHWKLLTCKQDTDEILNSFDTCKEENFDAECSKVLDQKNIDLLIEKCKFSQEEPPLSTSTEEGLLIQGMNLQIELLDSTTDTRPEQLYEKPPLLVSTNKIVRVSTNGYEELLHPKVKVEREQVYTTWLTETDIDKLEESVIEDMFSKLTHNEFIDMFMGCSILIISVFILCLTYKQRTLKKQVTDDLEKQLKRLKAKGNLKSNSRLTF